MCAPSQKASPGREKDAAQAQAFAPRANLTPTVPRPNRLADVRAKSDFNSNPCWVRLTARPGCPCCLAYRVASARREKQGACYTRKGLSCIKEDLKRTRATFVGPAFCPSPEKRQPKDQLGHTCIALRVAGGSPAGTSWPERLRRTALTPKLCLRSCLHFPPCAPADTALELGRFRSMRCLLACSAAYCPFALPGCRTAGGAQTWPSMRRARRQDSGPPVRFGREWTLLRGWTASEHSHKIAVREDTTFPHPSCVKLRDNKWRSGSTNGKVMNDLSQGPTAGVTSKEK
jgi:hypothetical protein